MTVCFKMENIVNSVSVCSNFFFKPYSVPVQVPHILGCIFLLATSSLASVKGLTPHMGCLPLPC